MEFYSGKKGTINTCYNMDKFYFEIMLREKSWMQQSIYVCIHLYEMPRIDESIKTEDRLLVA